MSSSQMLESELKDIIKDIAKQKKNIERHETKINTLNDRATADANKIIAYEQDLGSLREVFRGETDDSNKKKLKSEIFAVLKKLDAQKKKVRGNIKNLIKMGNDMDDMIRMDERLDIRRFAILDRLEPHRAAAWQRSEERENRILREKRDALSWNALGATRGNMDFLSMINAFERSEREPDIVEAEAALVPTNEPIAVSLDTRLPKTSWADGREVTVATRAPVLGSVVAKPLTMTDRAREKMSRKRTTKAEARLVEGGRKSRRKRKSRGKKRTHKKNKRIRKKKQTQRKKRTKKRPSILDL